MLSQNAVRVLYRLKDNGFTARLVGGCVRDLLLGREPKDFDLVTNATPAQIKRLFRNCRLIGRRFRLAHLHFGDEILEVATFRAAQAEETEEPEAGPARQGGPGTPVGERHVRSPRHLKNEEGMVLRDNVFGDPAEDAARRDFTVNALSYNIDDFSIIDYVGGIADLRRGMIRTIGNPSVRFTEDPVRMLRAVRFAAMLGFTVEAETWRAILELAPTVSRATPPRLYEEALKLLLLGEGGKSFQLLRQTGLFASLFPAFSAWLERETDGFPHTRVGHALDWVDTRIRQGGKVEPPLLFALLFSEYLEDKEAASRQAGAPPQQAIDMAIAGLLEELASTIAVPNRTGGMLRQIITCHHRLRKPPGRRAHSFISKPGFGDAMEYLRFISEVTGNEANALACWEQFVRDNPLPADGERACGEEEKSTPTGASQRVRRRRRRRPTSAKC
jgi:poly(A) polymerase